MLVLLILSASIVLGICFPYQKTQETLSYYNIPETLKNEFEKKNKKIEKYEGLLDSIQNIIDNQKKGNKKESDK